jgi:predicted 2-oxoglutarate/Fe(II)-dependent dioxygenase YbiX
MPNADLAAHFNLFLLPNFLDSQTCVLIRNEVNASPTTQAPVYIEGSDELVHETVRKTTSLHPSQEIITHVHGLLSQQKSALEDHFGQRLNDCEPPQFLRYQKGDFFVRHQDGNTEQLEFDHLRVRRISIVVFLNDSSERPQAGSFSGGTLNFYDAHDTAEDATVFSLNGECGLLVAFAADTVHEVSPIVSGERFTIITWFR